MFFSFVENVHHLICPCGCLLTTFELLTFAKTSGVCCCGRLYCWLLPFYEFEPSNINILIYLFQGKVSLNRIQSYLNKEELNDEAVTRNVNTGKFS